MFFNTRQCRKMFFTKTLALFGLACVGLVVAESKTRYSLKEKFDDSIVNGDLAHSLVSYIACDRSIGQSKSGGFAKKCNITHGTVVEKGGSTSCQLDFAETMTATSFSIHALSADKTVVAWVDEDPSKPHYLLKFAVVQFPSCNASEAKIDFEDHKSVVNNMIRYENAFIPGKDGAFDVFFENSKYCSDKVCRLSLNSQADIIKGPIAAYKPVKRLFDTATELNMLDDTYVVYETRRDDTGRISLIKPDGQVILQNVASESSGNNDVSTLDDKIRVCKKAGDAKIACELFNTKGESVFKSDVEIGFKFNSFTLFNLPNGEFVVASESRKHAYATKVGADGKRIGAVKLSGYVCKGGAASSVKDVYTESNQLCMSRMCYSDTRLDVIQKCYDNADIK